MLMKFRNSDETIHIPSEGFLDDLLEQIDNLQMQVDELKRLYYSNTSNTREIFLYGCEVAGSQYLDLEKHVLPKLQENDPLVLMREPDNNLILSRLMDEGNLLFGKTKTFHWDRKSLYLVVKVYMRG